MNARMWLLIAGVLGATGVTMGAYVSHGLTFMEDAATREAARATLQTAVLQHMLHAVALLGTGAVSLRVQKNAALMAAGVLFTVGVLLFSGLIYLRLLLGVESLRSLVPWGGMCLIAGWLAVAVASVRLKERL